MIVSQVQSPYSLSQKISYVPHVNVSPNKWFQSRNEGSSSCFKEFEVNSQALQRGGTTKASRKGYYDYQNPPWVNRNMSKILQRRHQRMKRDAILAMQQKSGVIPLVFDRISKGLHLGLEKKMSINDQEEKEMITNYFESSFEDSLEAIYGVISILPAK